MKKSNWIKLICLAIVALTLNLSAIAQGQSIDNVNWKLIKTKKKPDGWQIYKAKIPNTKLKRFKIAGTMTSSPQSAKEAYMEMITDPSLRITKKSKSLGWVKVLERTDKEMVVYDFMKGNFLVKDRDVIVRYSMFEDSTGETMGVKWRNIDWDGYEATDSIIRMPIVTGSWSFKKIDSTTSQATSTYQFHPGGNPPAWMVNMVAKATIPIEFEHLKKTVTKKAENSRTYNSEIEQTLKINIETGSGDFNVAGGHKKADSITIHYYKPKKFTSSSAVVYVIPGGGRNGDDYRDAWIEKAEKYNILVLSPEYNEKSYPMFWNYNLAGMYKDVKINKERTAIESFRISNNSEEWIFNDFDRIFKNVKQNLNLKTDTYDMFGHSAGGQILHRFAIFNPNNNANRILTANSGWYTLPTDSEKFPYGLEGTIQSSKKIDYSSNLIVFLGENDDENEKRGSLRRTSEADKQGLGRLSRGKYFYNMSQEIASKFNKEFNWKLKTIPNIGHDYRKMSEAAADYLYKTEK